MWTAINKAEELSSPRRACFNSKALQDEHGEITLVIRRRPGSILHYTIDNQLWGSLGSPFLYYDSIQSTNNKDNLIAPLLVHKTNVFNLCIGALTLAELVYSCSQARVGVPNQIICFLKVTNMPLSFCSSSILPRAHHRPGSSELIKECSCRKQKNFSLTVTQARHVENSPCILQSLWVRKVCSVPTTVLWGNTNGTDRVSGGRGFGGEQEVLAQTNQKGTI